MTYRRFRQLVGKMRKLQKAQFNSSPEAPKRRQIVIAAKRLERAVDRELRKWEKTEKP